MIAMLEPPQTMTCPKCTGRAVFAAGLVAMRCQDRRRCRWLLLLAPVTNPKDGPPQLLPWWPRPKSMPQYCPDWAHQPTPQVLRVRVRDMKAYLQARPVVPTFYVHQDADRTYGIMHERRLRAGEVPGE